MKHTLLTPIALSFSLFASSTCLAQGIDLLELNNSDIEELVWQSDSCLLNNQLYFDGDEVTIELTDNQPALLRCQAHRHSYSFNWLEL